MLVPPAEIGKIGTQQPQVQMVDNPGSCGSIFVVSAFSAFIRVQRISDLELPNRNRARVQHRTANVSHPVASSGCAFIATTL